MPVPALFDFNTGERLTAAKLQANTVTALKWAVLFKPVCHLYNSNSQSFISGTTSSVSFNTVLLDTDGMADTVNGRIFLNTPGIYRVTVQVGWVVPASGSGYRYAVASKSGAGNGFMTQTLPGIASGGTATRLNFSAIQRFVSGDYINVAAAQTSGAALNSDTSNGGCFVSAEWISA